MERKGYSNRKARAKRKDSSILELVADLLGLMRASLAFSPSVRFLEVACSGINSKNSLSNYKLNFFTSEEAEKRARAKGRKQSVSKVFIFYVKHK